MDAPDISQAVRDRHALRRRLYELEATQRWVHHVADLDSGEIQTTPLDRPIAPLSRAERLSQLGIPLGPSVLGGHFYRLTPSRPYQAVPEAWLDALNCDGFYCGREPTVDWHFNAGQPAEGTLAVFSTLEPDRRSLASITLKGLAMPNSVGHVRVFVQGNPGGPIEPPIDRTFAVHTVDLAFDPPSGQPLVIIMDHFEEIEYLEFRAISVGGLPPVFG